MTHAETSTVYHVTFKGPGRGLDYVEKTEYPVHGKNPRKLGWGILGLNRRSEPKLEAAPEPQSPTVEEVVNMAFEASVASLELGTPDEFLDQRGVLELRTRAIELFLMLSPDDQDRARHEIEQLTSFKIPSKVIQEEK